MTAEAQVAHRRAHEGPRDTVESIVIALILAFVFRAFVVEAFVIPTGSMAPTLYGAHGTIICQDCGTEFSYGLRDTSGARRGADVTSVSKAYCPNCRYPNTDLKINDRMHNPESGDRILVLKWPFDFGGSLLGPARWDVTVFKNPSDGTTNFIKRLVGLPNEVLMIVDGDVYATPTSELSDRVLEELDEIRHEKYELRAGITRGKLRRVPSFILEELDAKARIPRKTDVAQRALWFPVYDHDLPPRTGDRSQPRWAPIHGDASGWDVSGRRVLFANRGAAGDGIMLSGPAIRATCAYNINGNAPRPVSPRSPMPPFVSDQRVGFVFTPRTQQSSVSVRLTKHGRTFLAAIRADGLVTLDETREASSPRPLLSVSTRIAPVAVGASIQVGFENLDYRLGVRIAGREVLSSSTDRDSDHYYGPDFDALRRRRRLGASRPIIFGYGGDFDLTHITVDRDEYYFNPRSRNLVDWARLTEWAGAENPILLRAHEYFMLGDNTAASKDSRLWDQIGPHLIARGEDCQLGTVPRDQLIGKAFFVYWPSMQRIACLDWMPLLNRFGVVPDVGRMRWIR